MLLVISCSEFTYPVPICDKLNPACSRFERPVQSVPSPVDLAGFGAVKIGTWLVGKISQMIYRASYSAATAGGGATLVALRTVQWIESNPEWQNNANQVAALYGKYGAIIQLVRNNPAYLSRYPYLRETLAPLYRDAVAFMPQLKQVYDMCQRGSCATSFLVTITRLTSNITFFISYYELQFPPA